MPTSLLRQAALFGFAGTLLFARALSVPDLEMRVVASGLNKPTTIAFPGPNDLLVLEKDAGKVWHDRGAGRTGRTGRRGALDLAVSNAVECWLAWDCGASAICG